MWSWAASSIERLPCADEASCGDWLSCSGWPSCSGWLLSLLASVTLSPAALSLAVPVALLRIACAALEAI